MIKPNYDNVDYKVLFEPDCMEEMAAFLVALERMQVGYRVQKSEITRCFYVYIDSEGV